MREFNYAMKCLKQIVVAWQQGKHVVIEVVNDVDNNAVDGDDEHDDANDEQGNDNVEYHSGDDNDEHGDNDDKHGDERQYRKTVTSSNKSKTVDTSHIVLPPKIKKRGRPKGAGLTVIGLPRKKKCIVPMQEISDEIT